MHRLEVHLKTAGRDLVAFDQILAVRLGGFEVSYYDRVSSQGSQIEHEEAAKYVFVVANKKQAMKVVHWFALFSYDTRGDAEHVLYFLDSGKPKTYPIVHPKLNGVRHALEFAEEGRPAILMGYDDSQVNPGLLKVPVERPANADEGKTTGCGQCPHSKLDEDIRSHRMGQFVG